MAVRRTATRLKKGLQQTTIDRRLGINRQEIAWVTVLTRERDIRWTHHLCQGLASITGTKYGRGMTRFNFLKPAHDWLTYQNPMLPFVAVILTAMLWFWLDAEVFELLQSLLLVLVMTGRTARSSQETPEDLSLLELPFALARDVDTFARYKGRIRGLSGICVIEADLVQNP